MVSIANNTDIGTYTLDISATSSTTNLTTQLNVTVRGKHLFILSGQSNMKYLDISISFTLKIESEFSKDNVIIVYYGEGGRPIRRWYKNWEDINGNGRSENGIIYDDILWPKVTNAIKNQDIAVVTFIWMQG